MHLSSPYRIHEFAYIPEDHIPSRKNHLTPRDFFITAILSHLNVSNLAQLNLTPEQYLMQFHEMTNTEASNGLRAVFNKGLVTPLYNFEVIHRPFDVFMIISDDKPEKLSSYLSSLIQSTPRSAFRVNDTISSCFGFVSVPNYLKEPFFQLERRLKDIFDIERTLLRLHQFQSYNSSSLFANLLHLEDN